MKNIYTENNCNKFSIYTLGCKTNQSESDFIAKALTERGFKLVDSVSGSNPDFVIINTCTVTTATDRKTRQLIRRIKNKNPFSKLLVTGCYTVLNKKFLTDNNVEFIVSNKNKCKIPDLIYKAACVKKKFSGILAKARPILKFPDKYKTENINTKEKYLLKSEYEYEWSDNYFHSRALVKIQDGCEQKCSYCIVPAVRGHYTSTCSEKLINEIDFLVKIGHEEAVITGIHVGKYGIDFHKNTVGLKKSLNGQGTVQGRDLNKSGTGINNLTDLLTEILNKTCIKRLRLSSIEINEIGRNLIYLIKRSDGRIARHLHIPLQSGSNRVLELMNRSYTGEYFLNVINKIKDSIPQIAITTDVIVGFPGETESDFLETIDLVNKVEFSKIHIFKYSKRPGTKSALFNNQVSEIEKNIRRKRLINAGFKIRQKFLFQNLGKIQDVVCEEIEDKGEITRNSEENMLTVCGTSENYLKVYFNLDFKDFKASRGKIIKVRAESLYNNGLFGSVVNYISIINDGRDGRI